MQELRAAVREADAVLIATPEYNHSIPGVLKNALDWVSRPAGESSLMGKPAAAVGASTGMFGAVWAQAETRKVLGALGGRVVEARTGRSPAPQEQFEAGECLQAHPRAVPAVCKEILAELVSEVEELRGSDAAAAAAA